MASGIAPKEVLDLELEQVVDQEAVKDVSKAEAQRDDVPQEKVKESQSEQESKKEDSKEQDAEEGQDQKEQVAKEENEQGQDAANENEAISEAAKPKKTKDPINEDLKPPKLTNVEDVTALFQKYYAFLSSLEKYEDPNTLYVLKAISKTYWERKSWREGVAQALIDTDILVILKKILVYANNVGVFSSDAIWFPTYYALSIIWNFTDASEPLAQKVIEMGFIKYYTANLRHEPYMTNQASKNVEYMLKSSLSTMQNCVRHVPIHSVYVEENLVEALKPYMTSEAVMLKALSVMTVSNLISEDENSKLEDTGAIPFMVKCMSKSLTSAKGRFHGFSSLELAEALVRMAVNDSNKIKNSKITIKVFHFIAINTLTSSSQVLEYNQNLDKNTYMYQAFVIKHRSHADHRKTHNAQMALVEGFSTTINMPASFIQPLWFWLYSSTCEDELVEAGALPSLVTMLQSKDEDGQHIAAKLVWTLSFDDDVKQKIIQEPGLVDSLKVLELCNNKRVVRAAKGALWKISGEEEHQKQRDDTDQAKGVVKDSDKHIFISYQHENKEMVHEINRLLKADGHKVWIDSEQMGGSTLESMAGAVENARVVLVCASEKYKLSPSCRTEAEYTFQLKKPIIPLMMQRYYKADGWLGMLMGAKMYINFDGKFEVEVAYQMLLKELQPFLRDGGGDDVLDGGGLIVAVKEPLLGAGRPMPPRPLAREPSAADWSTDKVVEWMTNNGIDQLGDNIKNFVEKMNGKLLVRFCKLKQEAPDFFYSQMTQRYELDMMSILVLAEAMDKLV